MVDQRNQHPQRPSRFTKNTDEDASERLSRPKSGLVTVRTIISLLLVSGAVYTAFFVFACKDKDLYCRSVYEWQEIALAIALVLGGLIGFATICLIIIKLLGSRKQSGISWEDMNQKQGSKPQNVED